ncbi:phage tail tape measure protein [Sporosarcina sp. P18a]|uniref:phage tail tape measure protein n=1 Tax=Sporosarcina sp. P18a TaxID=2048259 RepID=UPI000C16A5A0|nr:phage tail tape measure protein [Sporosarcina sp. P18a]PIC80545.1 phage tail tape measure protein [Sporosarcina sp. P18a]
MAKKAMEMTIEIAGKVGGSLGAAFKKATGDIDDLKKKTNSAKRELSRLGKEFSKGNIHQSQYAAETAKVRAELRKLEGDMRRVNALSSKIKGGAAKVKAVAGIAAVVGATAVAGATVKSINVAADFEAQMSKVQSKTQASASELSSLRQTAIKLGASTSLSAGETAIAMDELAAKGFDANKIIGAMPGIIAAAEASGEDLVLTSDTVATAINVWSLEATEASHVADVLAMSANQSAAGVHDLAQTFKYAGAPAAALGISLEEVSAAAGIMTDAGLEGGNAGTSLRASLLALNNPAKAQEKIMKKLGFSIKDSNGKAKSLSGIIEDLAKSTEHMSEADKVATVAKLVGTEAVSGFLSLMKAGPEKIDNMTTALEKSTGTAAKAAAVMKDNYAGAKEEFFGSVESSQIAFGTPILGVLKDTFQGLTGSVEQNIATFENLGGKAATALSDILDPFKSAKPEINPELRANPDALAEYESQMAKYDLFKDMDFGDKVVYSLETAMQKAEEWLGGSGGETMGRIFSQLGEIAAKTWVAAFTGAVGGTIGAAMEGNVAGALGLGAAGWMLGGGTMVKGAIGAGKWAMESRNVKKTTAAAGTVQQASTNTKKKGSKNTKATAQTPVHTKGKQKNPGKTKAVAQPSVRNTKSAKAPSFFKNAGKGVMNVGGKVAKYGNKAMLPLAFATEAFNVIKSKDKVKASGQAAGGLTGALGGGKVGAAIGTAIAPGIGTAIGGLVGGAAGYIGGKWAGGKAVDAARGDSAPPKAANTPAQSTFDSSQLNASANELAASLSASNASMSELQASTSTTAQSMSLLATYTGQASGMVQGAFTGLQSGAEMTSHNMSSLAMVTGEASGMIYGSFATLQSSAEMTALSMSLLTSYTSQASGMIYGSFSSLQSNAEMTALSMSLLASYTGQASGMMYGSFSLLQSNTQMTALSMSLLASYTGQASGMLVGLFYPLQASTSMASGNMSLLASYIGQASGWISSLQGIQSAGQRVVSALYNLESRINSVPLPGGTSAKRVSFDG